MKYPSLVLSLLLLVAPTIAEAQSITGNIRDQATGNPIVGAQVSIEGQTLGAVSQADGRYLILNVPVGTHTLVVETLGYRAQTVTVTVAVSMPPTPFHFIGGGRCH